MVICLPTENKENESPLSEIMSLIYRWGTAHENNRSECIFSIIGVEYISSELQRSIAVKIDQFIQTFESRGIYHQLPRLVIILDSSKRQNQYLFQAFTSCRREYFPLLSDNCLRELLDYYSTEYGNSIRLYYSKSPGQGKTSQIIHDAKLYLTQITVSKNKKIDSSLIYHLPLHYEINKSEIIQLISKLTQLNNNYLSSQSSPIILHIEIGTVKNAILMSQILFEFIFFSGLLNYETGQSFCWKSHPHSRIFIELVNCFSSNRQTAENEAYTLIRLCNLLPKNLCEINSNLFINSCDEILSRTIDESQAITKYHQLKAVSQTLHSLAQSGKFPGNFWSTLSNYPNLTSTQVYNLLKTNFKINPNDSAHRLWSLISIFYFQLQNIFHPESYIANTYMLLPDDFIKNVIKFLIFTVIDVCQPATNSEISSQITVTPWKDINHEFLCTQSVGNQGESGGGLSFLCLDSSKSNLNKFQGFRTMLTDNGIQIDTTNYEQKFVGALNSIISTSILN